MESCIYLIDCIIRRQKRKWSFTPNFLVVLSRCVEGLATTPSIFAIFYLLTDQQTTQTRPNESIYPERSIYLETHRALSLLPRNSIEHARRPICRFILSRSASVTRFSTPYISPIIQERRLKFLARPLVRGRAVKKDTVIRYSTFIL